MIFNLAQKYASVLSAFVNTVLIVSLLDLEHLGFYAFLTASASIFSVFLPLGLRSVYLREIVKCSDDLDCKRAVTALTEIVPKLSTLVTSGVFVAIAWSTGFSIKDALSIALIGSMLASIQLTSQKLRTNEFNSLSQLVLNIRPIVLTILLLSIGVFDSESLERYFLVSIIASFGLPAVVSYVFWLIRFHHLVFSGFNLNAIVTKAQAIYKEIPGLFMLALGQKVIAKSDVILVTALLNLDAAGIYRICTQIVTVANSSLFPIRTRFVSKYARLLNEQKLAEAEAVARRVARLGVPLYIVIYFATLLVLYQVPYLEDIKHRPDFMFSLGIFTVVGLVKAGVPMIDNYVVFRNNSNKGGMILLGVVSTNLLMQLMLIPLLGLPGACLTALMSIIIWLYSVKRFL